MACLLEPRQFYWRSTSWDHKQSPAPNWAESCVIFFSFSLDCLSLNQQSCSNDRIGLQPEGGIHWCGLLACTTPARHTPGCTSTLSRASAPRGSECVFSHRWYHCICPNIWIIFWIARICESGVYFASELHLQPKWRVLSSCWWLWIET